MASSGWNNFYSGSINQQEKWTQVIEGGKIPWYLVLEISGIVIALSALIIFVGAWLKGSPWINKTNPYIKGQVYIRTKWQNLTFRLINVVIGITFVSFFAIEAVKDTFEVMDEQAIYHPDWRSLEAFPSGLLGFVLSPWRWYYQCYLTAIIIGVAVLLKKYKVALIVWPMALVGAMSVFLSTDATLNLESSFQGFGYQRSLIEHLLIILFPIFIITSQRYSYTISNTLKAATYMFMMSLVIYILFSITSCYDPSGEYHLSYAGESLTIAEFLGHDEAWLADHYHLFMWCMLVPFGIACMIVIVFIRQSFYHYGNTDAKVKDESNFFTHMWNIFVYKIKHMWKQWWVEIKEFEISEFTNGRFIKFFTRSERQEKTKFVLFGSPVGENQTPDDNNYKISMMSNNKAEKKSTKKIK